MWLGRGLNEVDHDHLLHVSNVQFETSAEFDTFFNRSINHIVIIFKQEDISK